MECRICFEGSEDEPFISPCACKGTGAFVHRSCLMKWRNKAANREAYHTCMECRQPYKLTLRERGWCVVLFFTKPFFYVLYGPFSAFGMWAVGEWAVPNNDAVAIAAALTCPLLAWLFIVWHKVSTLSDRVLQFLVMALAFFLGIGVCVWVGVIIASFTLTSQLMSIRLAPREVPVDPLRQEREPLLVQNA